MISTISFETPVSYGDANNQSFEIFQNYQEDLDFMQEMQGRTFASEDSKGYKILNLQDQINENIHDLQ